MTIRQVIIMISKRVREVHQALDCVLHEVEMEYFKPGIKLTFLARMPGNPEGDMLLTKDDLDEVIKAIERSKTREEIRS